MLVNTLCRSLRKLVINSPYYGAAQCYTRVSKNAEKIVPVMFQSNTLNSAQTQNNDCINFTHRSINVDLSLPIKNNTIMNIIDMPFSNVRYEDKIPNGISRVDLPILEKIMDLPTNERVIEKQAHRMIKIRKKKMKKHQRKKLRKRMKNLWAKIRHHRNVKKEKLFQMEQVQKVVDAQKFNAEEYVKSKLEILEKERLPITYYGDILPSYMIRKFLNEKKAKEEARRSKPRLKL